MDLDDFISDIRNQLSIIIETAQIISNSHGASQDIQAYCELISTHSYQILETIDHFYDLS